MRARAGVRRGFTRLSDRIGMVKPLQLIAEFTADTAGGGTLTIPNGTVMVHAIVLGAGGGCDGNAPGCGGGSAELVFSVSGNGLTMPYAVGAHSVNVSNPGGATTLNLPDGLGSLIGYGGSYTTPGFGFGPQGTVIRFGGDRGRAGQGPFVGAYSTPNDGGGGAGPIGGSGRVNASRDAASPGGPGGGGAPGNSQSFPGAIWVRYYGAVS